MGWTKQDLIDASFEELGFGSGEFDITVEERQSALNRLDAMMALWSQKGASLGYASNDTQANSSLSDESGIPSYAYEAVYLNLAVRLGPLFGKMVSRETKQNAHNAYLSVLTISGNTRPPEKQFPGSLPLGAGNKPSRRARGQFFQEPTQEINTNPSSNLEF